MKAISKQIKLISENFLLLNKSKNIKAINDAIKLISIALKKKNKIMFCGNGGSASDSEHISAELIGRYLKKRKSYSAISLSSNISAVTAIANDYNFSEIFSRQIEGIGKKNDVLFAISTSGKSKNIIKALLTARKKKINTIFLTSDNFKSKQKKISDIIIRAPSKRVDRIQEMHIAIGHIICEQIEKILK